MPEVRYRPKVSRLLDEYMRAGPGRVADVSVSKIAKSTGIPRQTIYNWINADTDDPNHWLKDYHPEIAYQLEIFFSDLLGREVEVIERKEIDHSPRFQEMAVAAA